jgi:hypothetical protein
MKNTLRNLSLTVAALGLAAAASAQSTTQIERPWKVDLGVYFPTTDINGADEKVGGTFGLGYTFLRLQNTYDLEVELRGNAYTLDFAGGDVDVSLSQLFVNGYYRTAENPLFFGVGLGFGQGEAKLGNVTFTDDDTYFVYNLSVGYRFQPNVYGTVRYQGGSEDTFRGFSVGVGYRF